jgi:hypothetical protein
MRDLQMDSGSFPIWIGPYEASCAFQNAIALEALGRYAVMTGDSLAMRIYLRCAEATMHDLSFPDGELQYITQGEYRSGYTDMPWRGFIYGTIFTGDRKYIEFPLSLVMKRIKSANFGVFGEGAFAYDGRGILFYLEYADRAGILRDLPPY